MFEKEKIALNSNMCCYIINYRFRSFLFLLIEPKKKKNTQKNIYFSQAHIFTCHLIEKCKQFITLFLNNLLYG